MSKSRNKTRTGAVTRKLWSTPQFFSHPGVVEKLVRDEGALVRFTTPVLVLDLSQRAAIEKTVAEAIFKRAKPFGTWEKTWWQKEYYRQARAVLAALCPRSTVSE